MRDPPEARAAAVHRPSSPDYPGSETRVGWSYVEPSVLFLFHFSSRTNFPDNMSEIFCACVKDFSNTAPLTMFFSTGLHELRNKSIFFSHAIVHWCGVPKCREQSSYATQALCWFNSDGQSVRLHLSSTSILTQHHLSCCQCPVHSLICSCLYL